MASRDLNHLHPRLKPIAEAFVHECSDRGVQVLIYCTWRSGAEQDQLYALGRTKPSTVGVRLLKPMGDVVTNAKAGQSAHNFTINGRPAAKAFDCCPLIGGKPVWDKRHAHWQIMGAIAAKMGLEWYGKKGAKFQESPHFEMVT